MKKGFTLVELLAVIAVLAIIALIAVPLIVSLIHESKRKAAILSGEQYIKAVNYKIAQEEINGNPIPDGEYIIGEDEIEVDTKNGNNITGGYLIGESEVTWAGLCVNKFSVGYFDGNAFIENGVNYCADDASAFVEPPGILMNLICEDPNLYNTENRFKIKSAEDLACFSNTVNEGKNFSGKEIYLLSDLDLSLTSSYTSYTTKKYGDINGNGTVEALFTEFNTGAGFRPIGTSGKPFAGTFLGYGFSISNLKINRTTQYVGLFGYNTGIIRGMNLYGVNISSSNQDVGGVVGYNTGTIQSIYVDGSVSGSNDAGGIVGETASNSVIKDVVSSVNVGGGNGLGGIIGRGYSVTGSSALVGGSVVSSNGGYVGYISGLQYNSSYPGIVLSTITKTGGSYNQNNGTGVSTISILGLDGFIDTIVGGDNDEDGYYIDYDNGKYKIFSTARKPIKKLKQPGTQQNPYLIRNASDWKKVASRNLDGKYIKITADIDFKNEMFYPLGTTTNPFKGHLIGDMHTLSNITLHGYNNVGIIGYNQGTIEGLNLSRITVSSSAQNITIGGVGGLVGYNTGTIKGLNLYNINITTNTNDVGGAVGYNTGTIQSVYAETTVSGANDVGGVVGEAATNSIIKDVVANATVTGGSGLGGIIGRANKVSGGAALVGGSVLPNTSGYAAYISGLQYNSSYPGIALSTISKRSDFTYDQNNGTVLNEIGIFGLDYYIDTIVGGDNNEDGYYIDYVNGKYKVLSTTKNPIPSVRGKGTESEPYLIASKEEWKNVASRNLDGKYIKLVADIDFNNEMYYPLGTTANKFKGHLIGDMHTISNITIHGYNNIGIIGYNEGTIEGLVIDNVNLTTPAQNLTVGGVGGIVGYNAGIVKGLNLYNINIPTNTSDVGGAVGYNSGTVQSIYVESTVSGVHDVGGVVGEAATNSIVKDVVANATVTGGSGLGGIIGRANKVSGGAALVGGSVLPNTSGYAAHISGLQYNSSYPGISLNTIPTRSDWTYDQNKGQQVDSMSIFAIDNYVDTIVGGDNDEDGYYIDYVNNKYKVLSTTVNPIPAARGNGTILSPYIISNATEWKNVASRNLEGKYIRITGDIDFNNGVYYPLGTNSNKFKGHLNGDMHTISNVIIHGYDYVGLFGYNQGTIEGLNVIGVNASLPLANTNNANSGGLVGYNAGTVKGINLYNISMTSDAQDIGGVIGYNTGTLQSVYAETTVSGRQDVGGAIGESTNGSIVKDVVVSSIVSGPNCIGGVIGRANITTDSSVVYIGGSVTATSGYVAYIAPSHNRYTSTLVAGALNTIPRVGTSSYDQNNGEGISLITLSALDYYADTIVGGDDNKDGYYMDYVNNGYKFLSTTINPLPSVIGEGTEASPYMIANFDDWKAVSSRNLDGKYIVLTGDVDFTGKQYYPLGSRRKPFTGHIKGNMHTVSNATTSGYSDVGLFGKNQGTIEGFNFNNITINGTNNNIGIIGNNSGTVKGINGTNVTVTGVGNAARNVGGLVGNNSGTITEVSMQSTVSGYIDVGGVVGYSSYISNYILSNSTVSGNDEIGGVAGRIYGGNATLSNTVQVGGSITASSRSGRVAFYADRKTKHYALSTIPRGTSDSYISQGTDVDPSVINDLTTINSLIDIDTATTGDTNGSGYIFRYNNDNSRIIVSKAN